MFLRISVALRTGLILAAVFLMTVKPKLAESLYAVIALPLICCLGVGLLGTKPHDSAVAKEGQRSTS